MNDFLFVALAVIAAVGAISVVLCRKVVHMAASLIVALSAVAGLFFSLGANFVGATQLMVYVGGTVILLIFGVMLTSMQAKAELKTPPIEAIVGLASSIVLILVCVFTLGSVEWKSHFEVLPNAKQEADYYARVRQAEAAAIADVANRKSEAALKSVSDAEQALTNTGKNANAEVVRSLEKDVEARRKEADNFATEAKQAAEIAAAKKVEADGRPESLALRQSSSFNSLALSLTGLRTDNLSAHSYLLPFEIISFHLLVVLVAAGYLARPKSTQQEHETSAE